MQKKKKFGPADLDQDNPHFNACEYGCTCSGQNLMCMLEVVEERFPNSRHPQ